ncbi:hypothetical protein L873DRAFT_1815057 [Choiromyces venosus 120613-1]|uniref:Uncharacterized protein n=1 Tax=Choiromyces venosus 120613-1 TaxID=1336337 RepID=A0A3N4J6M3_9PEZI|nr:hypothetical protein L873DRAFT_1815057 [Choiromyces venosus 120613-1]
MHTPSSKGQDNYHLPPLHPFPCAPYPHPSSSYKYHTPVTNHHYPTDSLLDYCRSRTVPKTWRDF